MSDLERQSPRAAIRKWLQVTNSKSIAKPDKSPLEQRKLQRESKHRPQRHHARRSPLEKEDQYERNASRKHQRYSKSRIRQKHATDQASLANLLQAPPQKHSEENEPVASNAPHLAERLGLHTPFRTFKDNSDDDDLKAQSRVRKRRRRMSMSSHLEPAAANDLSDNRHDRPSQPMTLPTVSIRPACERGGMNRSPAMSQSSGVLLLSPQKPLKSYERRPRHKTRPDRYELKENERHGKPAKLAKKDSRDNKKQKKQKRKEKSGAALMHDYAAQNVAYDRLTLKSGNTLGLFGKGRASSPVRRKGLPDLAFSEMTFLTSRREKPTDSSVALSRKYLDKNKRRKPAKAADTEAEFSRYFMSAKPTSLDMKKSHRQQDQKDSGSSRNPEPKQASIDLPERPFLGFGSCGPNTSTSPIKSLDDRNSKDLRRSPSKSLTRSTSYLTWSQSRESSHASSPPHKRHHVEPLKSSKLSNRQRTPPASHKDQHNIPLSSSPDVQVMSSGIQEAALKPASKHGIATEAPVQNMEPQLAVIKQIRSRDLSQKRSGTKNLEPDAANITLDIKGSTVDNALTTEAAAHDGSKLTTQPQNQDAHQSAAREPQSAPPVYDLRPLFAPMPTNSPHQDQLDYVLEALLRDCSTKVVASDPASHVAPSDYNLHANGIMKVSATHQEHSRMHVSPLVNGAYATEALASASKVSGNPRSASAQCAPILNESRSTHTPSEGNLNPSNRSSSINAEGRAFISTQNQVDSRNAWNGYGTFYERQQEQVNIMPETATRRLAPDEAVQDNHLEETDHNTRFSDRVPGRHYAGVQDDGPYSYQFLNEENEDKTHQEIRHGGRYDHYIDQKDLSDSGASMLDASHDGFDDENKATNHTYGHKDKERLFSRGSIEQESEPYLFTTNMPDIYSSWQPRHQSKAYDANARVEDVDSAFPEFWTPHKLY